MIQFSPDPLSYPAIFPTHLRENGSRIPGYLYRRPNEKEFTFYSEREVLSLLDRVDLRLGSNWSTWYNWPGTTLVAEFCPEQNRVDISLVLLLEAAPEASGQVDKLVESIASHAFLGAPLPPRV